MLGWIHILWDPKQHHTAPLFLLCMVPLLCATKETTSVTKQPEQYLNNQDYVALENLPKTVANSNITVKYLCTRPCTVHMDVIASSEFRTGISVIKKRWKIKKPLHQLWTCSVKLMFPSSMVYRDDYIFKHSIDMYYAAVRAWVVHNDQVDTESRHNETMFYAVAKTFAVLDTIPPHQRPYKDHRICTTWLFKYMWMQREKEHSVCRFETDVDTLLSSPLASNKEHSGLIKTFQPFKNRELEIRRQQSVKYYPRFTLSIWMYLLDYCRAKECGIFHHIDTNNMYTTPLLFLTSEGKIHVQLQLADGSVSAILSTFYLPLYQWFRLDVTVYRKMIILKTLLGQELKSHEDQTYSLDEDIYFDDTVGYMALGGSKYVVGIDGFFGPVKYYRLRALQMDELSNLLPEHEIYHQIGDYYSRCMNVKDIVRLHSVMRLENRNMETKCAARNYYKDLYLKYGNRPTSNMDPWTKEDHNKYSNLFRLLSSSEWISWDFANDPVVQFGKNIFEVAMKNLSSSFHHLSAVVPTLLDASCSGYHKASYMLAIMYEIGLGVPTDPAQALLYGLVAAQGEDRLALLKLGYKHLHGIDHHSLDLDIAFAYYMNVAKKTQKDRSAGHAEQAFVEIIRLMDDDILKEQTRENDDFFLWLKQNAERGDAYAQHRLAQMLFWGQQGVTKNTRAAIEWYERGALENQEPVLMYDYAVLLFKGDGVTRNMKLALELMKKSAAKGQVEALNGLGWYYQHFRKDYVRAVKYWTEAYDKGNTDAAFNLGVMCLHGTYPGEPGANETRAFEFMSRASEGGHIEASINVAQYFITGNLESVPKNPETAVLLAKAVAEQNGNIGLVIRKAVNAYLDGSINEAYLNFILTAEAGVEMSQTNAAYLCEEYSDLDTVLLSDICVWRYYNFSVHQHDPSTYALLKMGDMYYYGAKDQHRELDLAMKMYTRAALQGDSQGFFNLAQLVQEGFAIPQYFLQHLKIETSGISDNRSLLIELYERCQNHSNEEAVSPCTLVLLYLQLTDAWHSVLHSPMIYFLVLLTLAVFIVQSIYAVHDRAVQIRRNENVNSSPPQDDTSNVPAPRSDQREPSVTADFAPQRLETRNTDLHR
ncbi:protein sel-1 homolog 3 isoform X1 [Pseudophryne corroboree]|uniref:protein sel-1 homolog 3 isoform X1 n=1 Tax=Pseudophryne corroboree TaxID=495146 RepID=UPI0030815CAB